MDTASMELIGELSIPVGEISHGNSTKRHIKSNQHMDTPHASSNYVKTTLNHGLSLTEVDWGDLKRETTKHGPCLMEVDWGEKIEPNHTSSECILMEVDWGRKLKPNHTSSGCILIEVDWGEKLIVNHTSECMLSEVEWGAHQTHQIGHSIPEGDRGGHDPSLYLTDGYMLSEVDWGGHDSSSAHMNGFLLSEVDWGAHDSSFFLYLVHIDHDANPKDFFTQGLWT